MLFKKSISPVVAMALLLVVAVVGTVGFQGWFNDFSSQLFTDTEQKSGISVGQTGIDQVIGNTLYFNNGGSSSISINKVEVAGEECYQSGSYSSGVSEIDLYDCMNNLSITTPEVVVYTNDKIYSKKILVPSNFVASFSYPQGYFVSVWDTTLNSSSGSSAQNQLILPLESGGTYNFNVDWGDGTSETITNEFANHTYSTPGRYLIKINGTIMGWRFANGGDRLKLLEIRQWGPLNLGNTNSYFQGASNFEFTGSDLLNLTGTTNLNSMFSFASSFKGDISGWDVSQVTDMGSMFYQATAFTSDLSSWNVSNVTSMSAMFQFATAFTSDLSNWDVSSVSSFSSMFYQATAFTSDLSSWNTSSATGMNFMFSNTDLFTSDLSSWDVSSVSNFGSMFNGADLFTSDLSSWNTSSATGMNFMFYEAINFNSDLSNWDVDQVGDLQYMFFGALTFNGSLVNWSPSSATNMQNMFQAASNFNQDISLWNVSAVLDMDYMLQSATSFNQNLSIWDVDQVTSCTNFNQTTTSWVLPQPIFSSC